MARAEVWCAMIPDITLHIVVATTGSHDDERTWIAGVFTDRKEADKISEEKGQDARDWQSKFDLYLSDREKYQHPGPPHPDMTYYHVTDVPFGRFGKWWL